MKAFGEFTGVRPKPVFIGALAVLALTIGWVAWKERRLRQPPPTPARTTLAHVNQAFTPWPGVPTLTRQREGKLPANTFHSTRIEQYLAKVAADKAAAEAARKAAEDAARTAAAEAARKAAEEAARKAAEAADQKNGTGTQSPPPQPPIVAEYVYRGMLARTDGVRLALIETRPPVSVQFYRVGEVCRGFSVTNIESRTVGLIAQDGQCQPLVMDEVRKVVEEHASGK